MHRGDSPTIGILLVAVLLIILVGVGIARTPEVVSPLSVDEVQYSVDILTLVVREHLEQTVSDAFVCMTCTGDSLQEKMIELRRETGMTNTNFYGKLRSGDFSVIVDDKGFFVVSFDDLWIRAHHGETKITRTFDAELALDEEGQIVRKIYKEK